MIVFHTLLKNLPFISEKYQDQVARFIGQQDPSYGLFVS